METVALGYLAEAIGLGSSELISLVGGGGKTTCLFALGQQLEGTRVLTTTTRMGRQRTGGLPVLFSPSDNDLRAELAANPAVLAWGVDAGYKALGVDGETCDRWFELADHVVVEADGSRRKPFKAPRNLEPVVPQRTTCLIACIGASALGRVIADQCQRPLRVAAIANCSPYQRLTPERAAAVLLSERGSRKDCPPEARFVVLVNQVGEADMPLVNELAGALGADATQPTKLVAVASHTTT